MMKESLARSVVKQYGCISRASEDIYCNDSRWSGCGSDSGWSGGSEVKTHLRVSTISWNGPRGAHTVDSSVLVFCHRMWTQTQSEEANWLLVTDMRNGK